jgi:hypothetical protein
MLVRGQIFVTDDAGGALSNLVEQTTMARLGIVLELGIVLTQAQCSAAVLATALDVADDRSLAVSGGAAATVQLLSSSAVISGESGACSSVCG